MSRFNFRDIDGKNESNDRSKKSARLRGEGERERRDRITLFAVFYLQDIFDQRVLAFLFWTASPTRERRRVLILKTSMGKRIERSMVKKSARGEGEERRMAGAKEANARRKIIRVRRKTSPARSHSSPRCVHLVETNLCHG